MIAVRALFVLVTILSFATPQVSWATTQRAAGNTVEISLTAPGVSTQLVRAAVKTDKTFGAGLFIAVDIQPLFPPSSAIGLVPIYSHDPPNLDLSGPPLAPRPPPPSL
jgi:hypothetical protein